MFPKPYFLRSSKLPKLNYHAEQYNSILKGIRIEITHSWVILVKGMRIMNRMRTKIWKKKLTVACFEFHSQRFLGPLILYD